MAVSSPLSSPWTKTPKPPPETAPLITDYNYIQILVLWVKGGEAQGRKDWWNCWTISSFPQFSLQSPVSHLRNKGFWQTSCRCVLGWNPSAVKKFSILNFFLLFLFPYLDDITSRVITIPSHYSKYEKKLPTKQFVTWKLETTLILNCGCGLLFGKLFPE